jgi:transposase
MKKYTVKEQLAVIEDAKVYGVVQAAEMHHVHFTSVYTWMAKYKKGLYDGLPDDSVNVPSLKSKKKVAKTVQPSGTYASLQNRIKELEKSNKVLRHLLSEAHNAI